MYGPTETTIWSATGSANPTTGTVPLGSPIANTQLYILDDKLRPLPAGMPGELFIGGDGVTRGYLNREDLTLERFLPDPFVEGGRMYRTGDLVRRSADGTLEFLGRMDFQVKVRGYRIELGEIESCLGQHPGIAEAVVLAREDKPGDVRIVAYLLPTGEDVPEDELRAHVRAFLTDYMIPAHFVAVEKFPLTPNGKIDRKALPKPGEKAAADDRVIEHVAPTDEIGIRVADIFKRALGVEKVGMLDNFFTLGGHSLLAIQVHRELKKTVASNLSITDLYRFPTVGGLAAHILDRGQASNELDRVASRATARRHAMASRRQAQRI
jgi:long-subunit acyl-CoA synthetase (AMP-forming)